MHGRGFQVSEFRDPFLPADCSAGFFLSFTGSVKQAPQSNMFFTTYYLYDIL